MALFQRNPADLAPEDRDRQLGAYKEGRQDERTRLARDADRHAHDPALKDAYERGRRDAAARRRGSPLIGLLLLLAAVAGGTVIYLAVREGSFASGGEVVDRQLAKVSDTTSRAASGAADSTGNALENAGQNLKATTDGKPPPTQP